jgi:hypothetical protein
MYERKVIEYGKLAKMMVFRDARAGHTLGRHLGIVGAYCVLNDLPPLNAIVVTAATGLPGPDVVLRQGRTPQHEIAAVLKEDWFQYRVPTTGTLRKVWDNYDQLKTKLKFQ